MLPEDLKMISSTERPAWVSTPENGGLLAFKHRHCRSEVVFNHFGHTVGFKTRREAAELIED